MKKVQFVLTQAGNKDFTVISDANLGVIVAGEKIESKITEIVKASIELPKNTQLTQSVDYGSLTLYIKFQKDRLLFTLDNIDKFTSKGVLKDNISMEDFKDGVRKLEKFIKDVENKVFDAVSSLRSEVITIGG